MRMIDLSHRIEAGMTTYKGLPPPVMCDFLTREASRTLYDGGAEFSIQTIEMVGNTGTYLDSPLHRYADGADLADLPLEGLAHLPALMVDAADGRLAVDVDAFRGLDVAGHAVLVRTGWDRHWRTDAYLTNHPFLTAEAATWLADAGGGAGRHRQPQYRRYARARTARPHHPARPRHSYLRAYDRARPAAGRRRALLCGAAQAGGIRHLPGARLRDDRLIAAPADAPGLPNLIA
ncbi:MAG: cyclase family protein [Sphingomonas fennica]